MTKANTTHAMRELITQVRKNFPFHLSKAELCQGGCSYGCAIKLLDYIDRELCDWENRLAAGETPNFSDLQKLGKTVQKIHKSLAKNHLI